MARATGCPFDPQISNDTTVPHYPHSTQSGKELRKQSRTFVNMDDPEHIGLRRMLTARFSIKRVEAMRPVIQTMVCRRGLSATCGLSSLVSSLADFSGERWLIVFNR
jgi:hypothetical protein